MAKNPFVILVPCHRVVAKQGLGGFAWGLEAKERLLEFEASNP
jgi:methylated-DNA-[protein]-cysteine S-methyltransferase